MNEQIKAIGRQAGLVFIEDGVYGQRWYSSRCGLDAVEYEKLVELIVAETLGVALYGDEFEQARSNVKQHFGVEE